MVLSEGRHCEKLEVEHKFSIAKKIGTLIPLVCVACMVGVIACWLCLVY